mgnify:CR=1 FL=1
MRDLIQNSRQYRDLLIEVIAVITVVLLWGVLTASPAL